MSETRKGGTPLWYIRQVGASWSLLFAGTFQEAIAEINRLHRLTGIQHVVSEVR